MSLAKFGVRKPVVANLVMFAIIGAGLIFGTGLRREFFPYVESRIITVSAPYPGAAPEEVENALATKIEDTVADLSGVKEISSTVNEGMASVVVEFQEGVPIQEALQDVKREIDAIQDLPDAVDNIVVDILEPNMPAIVLALYGDSDERVMKEFINQARDDLLTLPEITDISTSGVRADELRVEVIPERAIEYGISLPTISDRIRSAMIELPGGSVRTSTSTISIRSVGVEERAEHVRKIVVKATPDGGVIRVGDVAHVYDGFVDTDLVTRYQGRPTVTLTVFRVGQQDVIKISELVKAYTAGRNGEAYVSSKGEQIGLDIAMSMKEQQDKKQAGQAEEDGKPFTPGPDPTYGSEKYKAWKAGYDRFVVAAPPGTLETTTDLARFVEGRLDLLLRNARSGGILVFLTLVLLLNWRISFWVAMGLVVSLLGTLAMMSWLDISLNFLTMFGLIIVIGILVDDAIVVAENITARHEQGEPALVAAVNGADQVGWPVVSTVLTTIFAFLPLALMNGQVGDFMNIMPVVVGCALGVSLIESLFILPMHMGHSLKAADKSKAKKKANKIARLEQRYDAWRDHVISGKIIPAYAKLLRLAIDHRYVTIASVSSILIVSMGMVISGRLQFILFETDDAETINTTITMPIGTPMLKTEEIVRTFETIAMSIPEVQSTFAIAGAVGDLEGAGGDASASHLGQVILELTPAENRERSSAVIIDEILERAGPFPEAKNIRLEGVSGGPSGPAMNFTVAGDSIEQLDVAVARIKEVLGGYEAIHSIADDADRGQRELRFTLRDGASDLGFTRADLGRQIQAAVFGLEAFTFAGDREDVDVRVTVPSSVRRSTVMIEDLFVFTPMGVAVPLGEVALIEESQAYATIRRLDRKRTISVQADVYREMANPDQLASEIQPILAQSLQDLHGVSMVQRGRQKDFADSMSSLPLGMLVAMGLIYVVLSWLFASFVQPLVVMLAIPFALIGMIWGHIVMGSSMTFLSMIGFIALAGIVVNDSLIFMEFFNERRAEGMSVRDAGYETGKSRFRAIMLTTITTVLGLLPMMMEKSFQAQFLIPMAITIAFGLMSATFIILLVLPSLLMILDDVVHAWRVMWSGNVHLERKNPNLSDPELAVFDVEHS